MGTLNRAAFDMGWSEIRLHAWLGRRTRPEVLSGSSGHDAAVLRPLKGRPVLCVDQTIEGVHFESDTKARLVGLKGVGRALSDLAATAARPHAVLLALSAPASTTEAWMRGVIDAVAKRAEALGCALVGGDLAACEGPRSLTVSALGQFLGRGKPPGRDRMRAGDVVLLTGPVGGSRLGRHAKIEPRIAEGRWLAEHGARALMDVSDGLALDLSRMAAASSVAVDCADFELHRDAHRLAKIDGRSAHEHGLFDGEDHELLASMPARTWNAIEKRATRRFAGLHVVGRVRSGSGLRVPRSPGAPLTRFDPGDGGWVHGR